MLDSSKAKSAGTQSPDVQFRETDGEFLKQQARIWLEAVLNERFDKETSLADLLVDGEILLRVSTTIRGLLRKHADADGEPASPKSMFPEASFYGKHSGKYLPYSNVDSFLKVCQKLGLTGVDLFSPPDVVEKKEIRRVCSCIRALSKKARARHLEVPEFDYVTHSSVSMPTEFVGGIRDSFRQASANNSPSNLTPDKGGLSPLSMKRPPSGLSLAQADTSTSDILDRLGKEPVRSLNFDESVDTSRGQQQSVIDPDTPPVAEEDSGFSSGSRSGAVSDDEKGPPEGSFSDDADEDYSADKSLTTSASDELQSVKASQAEGVRHQNLDRGYVPSEHSSKALQGDADTAPEVPPASKTAGLGEKDGNETKKGAWIKPILAAALALLGASLMLKPRDSSVYEVKQGDTLSEISRRVGKSSWQELVLLNPDIKNPDLIHPSDKLRLHS